MHARVSWFLVKCRRSSRGRSEVVRELIVVVVTMVVRLIVGHEKVLVLRRVDFVNKQIRVFGTTGDRNERVFLMACYGCQMGLWIGDFPVS